MIRPRRVPLHRRKPASRREIRPDLRVNRTAPVTCLLCDHTDPCMLQDSGAYQCLTCKRHWRVRDYGTSRSYRCVIPDLV